MCKFPDSVAPQDPSLESMTKWYNGQKNAYPGAPWHCKGVYCGAPMCLVGEEPYSGLCCAGPPNIQSLAAYRPPEMFTPVSTHTAD